MITVQETLPKTQIQKAANVIRSLSIDAIDAANSGHPGLPLGCAEIGAALYSGLLKHNPDQPNWIARDRFVLSAGHGSMLLYACLHLAGFDVSMEHIKNFRQANSPCAGHPEFRHLPGVETTTGPLGQGFAMSVGIALGQLILQNKFDTQDSDLFDAQTICLAGDGDLMEGVAAEAASLAGHLNCHSLTVIYDSNDICLDGKISECFTEDVSLRFKSYGWQVVEINGHSIDQIVKSISQAKAQKDSPTLIIAKTTIGYGSPNRQGSSESHGKALGAEESRLTKQNLGIDWADFTVPQDIKDAFSSLKQEQIRAYEKWQEKFDAWKKSFPDLAKEFEYNASKASYQDCIKALDELVLPKDLATRQHSGQVLQKIAGVCSSFVGGSADLSCSDNTFLKEKEIITAPNYSGQNIKFGVREFAMASIINGLALSDYFKPYCGTFLVFSDYMRNAIRLAALMQLPVVYQFTHDSVFLGEDGPTHQPVEHLASLRAIPNLVVFRPADEEEVKGSWQYALQARGPVAIVLSRQSLKSLANSSAADVQQGAYILKESNKGEVDVLLLSSGSEVSLALETQEALAREGKTSRVVSFVSWELFDQQPQSYQTRILEKAQSKVVLEAQSKFAWERYVGRQAVFITVDEFGLSAPLKALQKKYGFSVESVIAKIKRHTDTNDKV